MPTWDFTTPGAVRLDLEVPVGRIEIETNAGEATHVELDAMTSAGEELIEDARVECRERSGVHEVQVIVPERRGWFISFEGDPHIRLRVMCPAHAELTVRTQSAEVDARGEYSSADVKSASGDVRIADIEGDARVKTASGDVALQHVGGRAQVNSASGDLAIERVDGDAQVQLVSGDVLIRDAGASVRANTVSGDQRMEAVAEGVVESHSVSGDVWIGVRRGSRVHVDANTVSGSTSSELELSDTPDDATGEDEGPSLEIRAKTISGDIAIARASVPVEHTAS
jgi:DUF4097 and DUF4098 domain-containing protein YvlB